MDSIAAPRPPQPPPAKLYDLEVTIISAKHIKNVNWKNGNLKPYAILWVDPDRRQATKPDDHGSTRPVWNERFVFPLTLHPRESILSIEIFHSKPSETPKPLVGTLRFEIRDLLSESDDNSGRIKSLDLRRPSGRPQGKIRLRLALIERPVENYQTAPPPSYYYHQAAPHPSSYISYPPYPQHSQPPPAMSPPLPPPQQSYSYGGYTDSHPGYYASYYSQPPRPYLERQGSYGVPVPGPGPSAPVDYTPHDYHRRKQGVGAVTGAIGGLVLDEGGEENVTPERPQSDAVSTTAREAAAPRYFRSEY